MGECKCTVGEVPRLNELFPVLNSVLPDSVINYDGCQGVAWTEANLYLAPALCVLYVIFCFGGKALMKDRVPFGLKTPLALWNLGLSIFSFLGMLQTAPLLIHTVGNKGVFYTVCRGAESWYGCGITGFWTAAFIWSKVPELIDTVFIVLRKKPLRFLHWYHHITVLLFCWHSHGTRSAAGLWFVSMNFTVHGVMYMYYFLTAVGYRPNWAAAVTILQISQMFVGMWVCGKTIWHKAQGDECNVMDSNIKAGVIMYTSYMCLFVHFALNRFVFGKGKSKKGKVADGKKKE